MRIFISILGWGVLLVASSASSQDLLKWRGGIGVVNDDNFQKGTAGTERPEQTTTQTLGINLALPYSLQRFELDASMVNNLHREFANFDFVAQNYSAAWRWSYTPQFHGSLTATRAESLNPANDAVNPGVRNTNVSNTNGIDVVYELGASVHLLAGYSKSASVNEQALIGLPTVSRSTSYTTGIKYVAASGGSVTASSRYDTGSSSSEYTLKGAELSGMWQMATGATINAKLGYVEQHFDATPLNDFSGNTGALGVSWNLTGKTSLTAGWQRELSSFQSPGSVSAQTDSITLSPVWRMSPKSSVSLQYRAAVRDDQGSPAGQPSGRRDKLQDTSIAYSWQPRPFASLSASFAHSARSSNIANLDFTARIASVSAQFTF